MLACAHVEFSHRRNRRTSRFAAPRRSVMTAAVARRRSSCSGGSTRASTTGSTFPCRPGCMPPAAEPYSSSMPIVFDTSAWNRRTNPAVPSTGPVASNARLPALATYPRRR